MKDWERDGSLKLQQGQMVSDEVVDELIGCVPPAHLGGGLFQVGEAKDNDLEHPARELYDTFQLSADGWIYLGTCLLGKTEPRKGYIETRYAL